MKLHTTTISSYRLHPGTLLAEGDAATIVTFLNTCPDTEVGHVGHDDLEENGGNWANPPDGWTPEAPFFFRHKDTEQGGFTSLEAALRGYVNANEEVMLEG